MAIVPLRNCRKAILPQGKLLLVEWIFPGDNEPKDRFRFWDTVTYDLIMLGVFGSRSGRVRTRFEFEALLREAGFALADVVPTRSSVCVIEASPL